MKTAAIVRAYRRLLGQLAAGVRRVLRMTSNKVRRRFGAPARRASL